MLLLYILACHFITVAQTSPPYSVNWVNQVSVTTNGSILSKNGTASLWNAGATSSNILPPNTDGWLQFSPTTGSDFIIGFAINNVINYDQFNYGFHIDYATGTYRYYEGASTVSLGSWQAGKIFRIERVGTTVNYYYDGVVVRTLTSVDASIPLQIKALLKFPGKATPAIDVSFDSQLILQPTITGTEGNGATGSIALTVTGGTSPYTYSWSSGEQVNTISDKSHGAYTVTVIDAAGRSSSATYTIGYKVNWIDTMNVINDGVNLYKNESLMTWNISGGSSSNALQPNTDGWMELTVSAKTDVIMGFAVNSTIDADEFAASFHIDNTTSTFRYYEGTSTQVLGYWRAGDIFTISRLGSALTYYKNGEVVRSVTFNAAAILRVKTTLRTAGAQSPPAITSFDGQITILPMITGAEGPNGTGGIALNVTGGKAPYTYNWSSGEQTSAITNKTRGTYTVNVVDASGRSTARTYAIGYKINWIDTRNVSNDGVRLHKTSSLSTWKISGGASSNLLLLNNDGWMEFTTESNTDLILGLSTNSTTDSEAFSGAYHIDLASGTYRYYEGTTTATVGYWQAGDILRIGREGSTLKYYRNGILVRTVAIDPSYILKVKATIRLNSTQAVTPVIVTSFDASMALQQVVAGTEGNTGDGSISLTVIGGNSPYTYSWSSGEQASNITGKPYGNYTVTVTDALGRSQTSTVALGYRVRWTNLTYVYASGLVLVKNNNLAIWNAGGASENILKSNTDGWIEFVVDNNSDFIAGLSTNTTMNDASQFSYGVLFDNSVGKYRLYEGTAGSWLAPWKSGDVIRISREASQIKYYQNGNVIRTVSTNPALQLRVKSLLKWPGKATPVINTSFWISDGVPRNYYSIASGIWTNPSTWSLTEGGPAALVYPSEIDKAFIKGHSVTVSSPVKSADINIVATNSSTKLTVSGAGSNLTVTGKIVMTSTTGVPPETLLRVENGAGLDLRD